MQQHKLEEIPEQEDAAENAGNCNAKEVPHCRTGQQADRKGILFHID